MLHPNPINTLLHPTHTQTHLHYIQHNTDLLVPGKEMKRETGPGLVLVMR